MATSKLKLFMMNSCSSRSITGLNAIQLRDSLSSSFCTLIESPKTDDPVEVTESPELPNWVRISENNNTKITKTPEDDFVLPSLSSWMENYKRSESQEQDKVTVSNDTESDVKKITKLLVKPFESLDSVIQVLNNSGVTPSEYLVSQILKRFDNNWKSAYGVFIWAESQMGSKFSSDMYNLLVHSLGKSRKFDLMWEVVEQMVPLSYVTVNTMAEVIRRLGKAGSHEESINTFRRIEQFGVKKDISTLNMLIDSLAKEKNVERAIDIYQEFKNEIPPNSHTFNSLIHGWAKARNFEKAQTTMEEMKEHGICPDVVSYTSLIEAYSREKDFKKVDEILEEMQEKGCPPNVITYTIVMHALGKSKEIDKALNIYERIKSNCILDTSFYNSLISILSKSGRLKDARQVFDEMPSQGATHDTQSYNTMITSFCSNTQEEDALKMLHEMEMNNVKMDFDTYAPLLKMCCKLKRMKVISFLVNHMLENNVSVGIGTYSLLVRGLCKSGKVKHACLFLEDAVMKGFEVYDTMFKVLEMELEKQGMNEEKKRIQELKQIRLG
ncbi:pentatricopeptide repeat-containing protein At3g22670, mitochondrial [Lactuca sativa]|uniref:pentatricopeptide repeat-containing protein At3g22670, mitochondrial n=1 Tax=Lactuca sativa TaxID=4236 RepID=UPI000CA883F0|nr:pentatricopeptide repeat-containing protein At3g22670, mitochondrial [Lactuca sativa]XP_023736743.1 pentatricopeptide repeat-containing protein At3g22670, mitochondrial [Lactuca sativa]